MEKEEEKEKKETQKENRERYTCNIRGTRDSNGAGKTGLDWSTGQKRLGWL